MIFHWKIPKTSKTYSYDCDKGHIKFYIQHNENICGNSPNLKAH